MAENSHYLQMFIDEGAEHLQALSDGLLALENAPFDSAIVNRLFRSAHTLKGMAGAMQFQGMARLTHEMESVLDSLRTQQLYVGEEVLNVLFDAVDVLHRQLEELTATGTEGEIDVAPAVDRIRVFTEEAGAGQAQHGANAEDIPISDDASVSSTAPDHLPKLHESARHAAVARAIEAGQQVYEVQVTIESTSAMPSVRGFMVKRAYEEVCEVLLCDPPNPASDDFDGTLTLVVAGELGEAVVRQTAQSVLEVESIDVQLLSATEAETAAASALLTKSVEGDTSPAGTLRGTDGASGSSASRGVEVHASRTIRVDVERIERLMNLYSEFVLDYSRIEELARVDEESELYDAVLQMSKFGRELQDIILKIRMVPLDVVFNRFPRMVRDLSRALGKQVKLSIIGSRTEIDRVLADEIADPLVHILRNSIDHGIETPDTRRKEGKEESGSIEISAYQTGNFIFIEVTDDGGGIDREAVLKKATENGLVASEQAQFLTDEAVYDFLFQAGFSTATQVSDISGRGVGLDAVRAKVEELGGTVSVQSERGAGTRFVMRLPQTVSVISAMLMLVNGETYAVPTSSILYVHTVEPEMLTASDSGTLWWNYLGTQVPFAYLRDLLAVPGTGANYGHVAVVSKGDKLLAIGVDQIVDEQEIVVKPLGDYLRGYSEGLYGITILGNGQAAPIVDVNPFLR